jgi:DNA-binding GntR family transcriptional regulator
MPARLRRAGTTVEDLYQMLRERILKGEYFPGLRLSQQGLASELKVSRTPVREALSRLQTEGLVINEANRGMEVAPISNEIAEQTYAARLLIEPPILEAITNDIPLAQISLMEEALQNMERSSHRIRDFQEEHLRFHKMTHEYYPVVFRDLIDSFYAKINRHQRLYFSRPNVPEHFTGPDHAFCAALRARNGAHVRQIMEFHLTDAALGLVLDIDPDYRFNTLLIALTSVGVKLDIEPDGSIKRPTRISWQRNGFEKMPHYETNNLYCDSAVKSKVAPSLRSKKSSRRREKSRSS